MTRSLNLLYSPVLVFVFSLLLLAQTETVINARSKEVRRPAGGISSGWTASVNPDTTLEAVLKLDDPNLKAGSPVDYELVITNTGRKAVAIPQTLDWTDVDSGSSEQRYVRANVEFELNATNMSTFIHPPLSLYATAEHPSSALVLASGDAIRLLGTVILPATVFDWKKGGKAMLRAHFCESSVWVVVTPMGISHKRTINTTSTSETDLWCVSADQKYEVNFPPAQ